MLALTDSGILLRLFEPSDPLHTTVKLAVDALTAGGDKLVTAPTEPLLPAHLTALRPEARP